MSHLKENRVKDNVTSIMSGRANDFIKISNAESVFLSNKFNLRNGGYLSIFRVHAADLEVSSKAVFLKTNDDLPGYAFRPKYAPMEFLVETHRVGSFRYNKANIFYEGIRKNNTIYFAVYKNCGDNVEDIHSYISAMLRFTLVNFYYAA